MMSNGIPKNMTRTALSPALLFCILSLNATLRMTLSFKLAARWEKAASRAAQRTL
jgi:hypothetical protein